MSANYVKTLCGGISPDEALFAKIMIQEKLIIVLIDGGSSVNLLGNKLYQQLGEPSQIRVCNKNIIAADSGKMPVKVVNSYSSPTSKTYIWDNSWVSSNQNWDNVLFIGHEIDI